MQSKQPRISDSAASSVQRRTVTMRDPNTKRNCHNAWLDTFQQLWTFRKQLHNIAVSPTQRWMGGGGGGSEMGREGVVEADVRPITTKQRSPAGLDFVTARFSVAGGSEVPVPACPARALTYDGQSAWAQDGQLCWGLWHLSFGLSGRCADVTLSCSGGCVGRGDVGAQAVVCF